MSLLEEVTGQTRKIGFQQSEKFGFTSPLGVLTSKNIRMFRSFYEY